MAYNPYQEIGYNPAEERAEWMRLQEPDAPQGPLPEGVLWQQSPEDLQREQFARKIGGPQAQLNMLQDQGFGRPEGLVAEGQRQMAAEQLQAKQDREDQQLASKQQHEIALQDQATQREDQSTRAGAQALGVDVPSDLGGSGLKYFLGQKDVERKEERAAKRAQVMSPASAATEKGRQYARDLGRKGAATKAGDAAYKSALQGVPSATYAPKDMQSYQRALQAYEQSGGMLQIVGNYDRQSKKVYFQTIGQGQSPQYTNESQAAAADALPMTPDVQSIVGSYDPEASAAMTPEEIAIATRSGAIFPPDEDSGDEPPMDMMSSPAMWLMDALRGR